MPYTDVSNEDVSALREWIAQNPHLPQYRDDYFLRCVITGAKGSLQQAKIRFDNYHRAMQDFPTVYQMSDLLYSEESINFNKHTAVYLFPKKTKSQRQVIGVKFLSTDSSSFKAQLILQRIAFTTLLNIWDQNYGTGELIWLIDFENASMGYAASVTNTDLGVMGAISNSTPYKIKAIHLLRFPTFLEAMMNLIKKTVPEKIRDRFHIHSSYEELHDFFEKEDLPEDYGGTGPPISVMYEKHLERVKFHHHRVSFEAKNREEEIKKRPKSEKPAMADTFRKLGID